MADAQNTTTFNRRHLLRTIGGAAVGAAVVVSPVAVVETAKDRLERHLEGLQAALREVYPDLEKITVYRQDDSNLRFMITAFEKEARA